MMLLNVKVTLAWGHVDQFFSVILPSRLPPLSLATNYDVGHLKKCQSSRPCTPLASGSVSHKMRPCCGGCSPCLPLQVAVDESATIKDLEAHIARTYEDMYQRWVVVVSQLEFSIWLTT